MLRYISKSDIKPSIKTDHSLISLKIVDTPGIAKGTGLWKFNSQLLSDDVYTGYIRGIILMHRESLKDLNNESLKWELLKMQIRNATTVYSKTQASLKREYENNLHQKFKEINEVIDQEHSEENETNLLAIKEKLEKINAIKTEGHRVRSKAQFIDHNERSSKYFLNLEKRNAIIKNITRLKKDNHPDVTDTSGILNELASFYEKLYTSSVYCSDFENEFLCESLPQIAQNDKIFCDMEISLIECTEALKNMKANKSPGTDGITVEFYQYFWNDISDLVLNSIRTAYLKKVLSCDQKRGVFRLIPKKDKDLTDVKNWRPISLLNTDYKLIAHILANRLQLVLPFIISKDQSGYIKTRNISLILDQFMILSMRKKTILVNTGKNIQARKTNTCETMHNKTKETTTTTTTATTCTPLQIWRSSSLP